MRAFAVILLVILFAVAAVAQGAHDSAYEQPYVAPRAALEGGDFINCWLCDVVGFRNIQGGKHTGDPQDLNLDIGAGSTLHPGNVVVNWDVGRCMNIYNGRKQPIAKFCPRRITFYVPVKFKKRRR